MKIGILGAGGIAVQMAKTVAGMKDVENYAVAARSFERAQAFAEKYGFSKAYGSYEEMLADPQVDLVYIATPHSHHYLHAKMCLEAGKNVLCEKAFTVNADQARKLFALAKEKNLLITEAIWTRYMPSRKMIDDIISSGVIGEVTAVTANLNYAISEVERIRKPELAGGALLDVGVYTINFASMVLGDKLKDVQATAIFREGVDMLDTIAMVFEGDRMATLQCGAREISDRMGSIFGTKGYIQVQNINNPEKITVFDKEHKEVAAYLPPAQITGYEYEVEACARVVNTLKFNEDFLTFILLWHKEILGIFVIPTNIPSNISLAGTLLSTRLTQHGVMWQSHRISFLIPGKTPAHPILVKINFLHTVNCSFLKSLSLNQLPFRHSRSVDSLLLFPISVEELA